MIDNAQIINSNPMIIVKNSNKKISSDIDLKDELYYVYSCCEDSNDWIIKGFNELKEAEKFLLEENSNMFTTCLYLYKGIKEILFNIDNKKIYYK